ncbi:MAG TPA: PEP-CTERM sorting domain-containing protein, partial [Candidatus Methylacidiphilales bacterium]
SFAAPTQAITLSLANSTSTFDVTSAGLGAGTFDTLSLSNVALNLTGGTLVINFGSGTYNGSIQLFTLTNGSTITGTLASLTSNLGASETLTLDSTGLLTFSAVAVPEPPLFLMLGAGCGAVFLVRRSRIAGGRGCRS